MFKKDINKIQFERTWNKIIVQIYYNLEIIESILSISLNSPFNRQ
jgi:hypothetical protein